MSDPRIPKGSPSSALTEYRKNRMIYANFLIQQQSQTAGCIATVALETPGGVAPGSIMPVLQTGGLYTTPEERDRILLTSACGVQIPSGTVIFTGLGSTEWTAPAYIYSVEYLVVGGGGGSGGGYDTGAGGGGGGGMVVTGTLSVVPGTTYTIVVGDGGTAGTVNRTVPVEVNGGSGGDSRFGSILALGGGGGFGSRLPSGGNNGAGGSAATNVSIASLGGRGGGSTGGGGGGGGSSGPGGAKSGATAGTAGAGTESSLSGSSVVYGLGGVGGTGNTNNAGTAGASNTGNGARGGGATSGADEDGAKGGSGIVILRY